MELLSDRPLRSEPPPGPPRRCRPRTGVDHISGLPDDLLLQILVRLRCARAAAHTSLLSRRWRGLWRFLPELSFRGIAPGTLDTAIAQVARTELSLLDIEVPGYHWPDAVVTSLLRSAARLVPVVLRFVICGNLRDIDIPVDVPIYHRAKSIQLAVNYRCLKPPASGGEFSVLERLSILSCGFDMGLLVSQWPCLRVLELRDCWGLNIVMVHSTTIEELFVSCRGEVEGVDIVAPKLKKFTMDAYMGWDFNVSFLAPRVKDLSWHCRSKFMNIGIREEWRLRVLDLWMKEKVCSLDLTFEIRDFPTHLERDLVQKIAQLPNFSVLVLHLWTCGHVFGGMVLNLLGNCASIQSLKLFIERFEMAGKACPPNCSCDQLQDWRNQNISLMALEEVRIENFEGSEHEVDFMKLVFRCAPLMKRMTVILAPKVYRGCKKIWDIFKANPSVNCYVYAKGGKLDVY